jgi:hypothetical protein
MVRIGMARAHAGLEPCLVHHNAIRRTARVAMPFVVVFFVVMPLVIMSFVIMSFVVVIVRRVGAGYTK